MSRILINGFSSKTGGGRSILQDCLNTLSTVQHASEDMFFVITPDDREYDHYTSQYIQILRVPPFYGMLCGLPAFYLRHLRRIVKAHGIDAILNFGDIVLPVSVPQVYLFDWAYAVYPDSVVWSRMAPTDRLKRRLKLHILRKTFRYATIAVAQTPTMARRLHELYELQNVVVIANPVGLTSMSGEDRDFQLPSDRKLLLCLTNYAPHKNLELLIPLATLLRERGERISFVTTLNPRHGSATSRFLKTAQRKGLADWVLNVGSVDRRHVHSLFQQCHALFMPTLLESCCMPVTEAMFNRRSVIISGLDFMRDLGGDAAYYFDPLDADSACRAITEAFGDEKERQRRITVGWQMASQVNDWPGAWRKYRESLRDACVNTG